MVVERGEPVPESGWRNETSGHQEYIRESLREYLGASFENRPRYDSLSELHFSGTNRIVFDKISEGTATIISVELFYRCLAK